MVREQLLPTFAPIPDKDVRPHLSTSDWELLVSTWASLAEHHIARSDASAPADPSPGPFLVDLMEILARGKIPELRSRASAGFIQTCFGLIKRLVELDASPELLGWEFLADFSAVYSSKRVMAVLGNSLNAKQHKQMDQSVAGLKKALVQSLDGAPKTDLDLLAATLSRLGPFIDASPAVSGHLLAGSDFLDGLISAYRTTHPPLRSAILATAYLCVIGLAKGPAQRFSMLNDQLFALKAAADAHRAGPLRAEDSLVPELMSTTPILAKIRRAAEKSGALTCTLVARLDSLTEHRRPGAEVEARRKSSKGSRVAKSPFSKEKGKALEIPLEAYSRPVVSEHHRATISQIQEVFPQLGDGFIARLIDEYGDNADLITSQLFDGVLPDHLVTADRTELLDSFAQVPPVCARTELPARKNAFDGDQLDRLAVETSRLGFGKTSEALMTDNLLNDRAAAPSKASIMAALAAFDSDDDERDDTYDAADVGGAVDAATEEDDVDDAAEELLYHALQDMPGVFDRNPEARRGTHRARLRGATGWTDEAIEGWAYMLLQNPQRRRRLDTRYSIQRISQQAIRQTAWRAGQVDEEEEGGQEGVAGQESRQDHHNGQRGRGGRGRGRGGNVAGSPSERDAEQARRRKEANKGSRANHNRREGHAKKMARGGFPV